MADGTADDVKWPIVAVNDDGIRPAGSPHKCFYCGSSIGQPHGRECVIVQKRIKVRYIFEIEVDVPYSWDAGNFEFHRNEGSWCADNAIAELEKFTQEEDENGVGHGECLCNRFRAEFIEVVDDTPRRDLRESTEHESN